MPSIHIEIAVPRSIRVPTGYVASRAAVAHAVCTALSARFGPGFEPFDGLCDLPAEHGTQILAPVEAGASWRLSLDLAWDDVGPYGSPVEHVSVGYAPPSPPAIQVLPPAWWPLT